MKFTAHKSRICKLCGKEFIPTSRNQQCCTDIHTRPCPICGTPYRIKYASDREKGCSKACTLELRKRTSMERFGVDNAAKASIIKAKQANTCMIKYNAMTPFTMDSFQAKSEATCLIRYGVSNPMLADSIQAKRRASNKLKFGVEEPLKLQRVRDALHKLYEDPERVREIFSKRLHSSKHAAADGTTFDSNYELIFYNFCKKANLHISRRNVSIDIVNNDSHKFTYVDFEVDSVLVECKGGHLLEGCFDYAPGTTPIADKLASYAQHSVLIVTDYLGCSVFNTSSDTSYQQLTGVDITMFEGLLDDSTTSYDCRLLWDILKESNGVLTGFLSNADLQYLIA